MFENIGKKIKMLAKICFWVSSAISAITGFVFIIMAMQMAATRWGSDLVLPYIMVAIACFVLGPLVAWVSNFLLYGFGELVDNSKISADNSEIIKNATVLAAQDVAVISRATK